jgi:hypothetical protein
MKLYIETESGVSKNHPAFEDNLLEAFGLIPAHWEPFIRVERPVLGMYQVLDSDIPIYAKVDGVWTDVWVVRDMTAEEKAAVQQEICDAFYNRPYPENWTTWVLDEDTNTMVPPVPYPEPIEGVTMAWCGADNNWKEAPAKPVDNNQYKFDFLAWQWVQVVN